MFFCLSIETKYSIFLKKREGGRAKDEGRRVKGEERRAKGEGSVLKLGAWQLLLLI